ncbi:MAG TPA: hypothetical protein VEL76_05745 [Gemmataceae bacterium]|nr:hypothetical protein [Gemmataceae bacterium]
MACLAPSSAAAGLDGASKTVATLKKAGKVVQTTTRVVSKDGETLTLTVKGTNAEGRVVNDVLVFDKY